MADLTCRAVRADKNVSLKPPQQSQLVTWGDGFVNKCTHFQQQHTGTEPAAIQAVSHTFNQEFFMKRSIQKGFTLIDLMIVVAIIGI